MERFGHPGARGWYDIHRRWFPPDYRDALDTALVRVNAEGVESVVAGEPNSMFDGVLTSGSVSSTSGIATGSSEAG